MLKLLCCIFLVLGPAALHAQDPLFCVEEGTVLRYERRFADSGKLKWSQELSIRSVVAGEDGSRTVAYSTEFRNAKGRTMYGGPVQLSVKIREDGGVLADLAGSMKAVLESVLPDAAVSGDACMSLLPPDLSPGDVLPDAAFTLTAVGLPYKVEVSGRELRRRETIQTAAGSFDCVVVFEHKKERGLRKRTTSALTWYAPGIGMVRHDTYSEKGELETSEQLVSMIKR